MTIDVQFHAIGDQGLLNDRCGGGIFSVQDVRGGLE